MNKTDSRMQLRGKLDTLNAQIILIQSCSDNHEYIADIEEIRQVIRKIQRCEAMKEVYDERLILWGIDEDEIHTRSHNPERYYGLGHVLPDKDMKRESSELNLLRTLIRECELISCHVFDDDALRISHVLNRLSSAVYILTYKYLPEGYDKVIAFSNTKNKSS